MEREGRERSSCRPSFLAKSGIWRSTAVLSSLRRVRCLFTCQFYSKSVGSCLRVRIPPGPLHFCVGTPLLNSDSSKRVMEESGGPRTRYGGPDPRGSAPMEEALGDGTEFQPRRVPVQPSHEGTKEYFTNSFMRESGLLRRAAMAMEVAAVGNTNGPDVVLRNID